MICQLKIVTENGYLDFYEKFLSMLEKLNTLARKHLSLPERKHAKHSYSQAEQICFQMQKITIQ